MPNATVTYQRPDAEQGEHTQPYSVYDRYIRFRAEWTDRNGAERDTVGYMMKNSFHNQSYYPTWADADELTFSGSRLPDNTINRGGDGTDADNPQNWIATATLPTRTATSTPRLRMTRRTTRSTSTGR